MRYREILAPLALSVLLCGCATKYQEMGFMGGVEATQIDGNTFRVTAKGNGYTRGETIKDYALMKAAETTLGAGCDYFVVIGQENVSRSSIFSTPGTATSTTTVTGNVANTTTNYSGPQIDEVFKPGQDLMIKVFKGQKPENNPAAFDAHEVTAFLGPKVRQDPSLLGRLTSHGASTPN
jgi:hypothetical protein